MQRTSLTQINEQAAALGAEIKILSSLSWPESVEEEFIAGLAEGRPLPDFEYDPPDYRECRAKLAALRASFTPSDPLELFTARTIDSYILGADLAMAAGTSRSQELSIEAFGSPGSVMPGSSRRYLDEAREFIAMADNFSHPYLREPEVCLPAREVKAFLEIGMAGAFGREAPEVVVDANLTAKAAASATRIRLRDETCFSNYDPEQLLQHEVMVHALTALNGRTQPLLKVMGRGAPRTIATQEGLATFSEVITGAIDIGRLKRVALRTVAIDAALGGADFVEIFELFRGSGQSEREAFRSAARVFRGGTPRNPAVFTKDGVYLDGLMRIHTLFRWAISRDRMGLLHLLFCGRVAIEDLFELESALEEGLIAKPRYVPTWYARIEGLAGMLSFFHLTGNVRLREIERDLDQRGARHPAKPAGDAENPKAPE